MPFLAPKIYFFIFGFHLLVWCPKWEPASNNCFIVIADDMLPPSNFVNVYFNRIFYLYTKTFNFAIHFYIKNKNLISHRGTDKKHSKKISLLFSLNVFYLCLCGLLGFCSLCKNVLQN